MSLMFIVSVHHNYLQSLLGMQQFFIVALFCLVNTKSYLVEVGEKPSVPEKQSMVWLLMINVTYINFHKH